MGELVTQHVNSEGERVSIERVLTGDFVGQLTLVVYDDPPLGTAAPMLLDEGTRDWLLAALAPSSAAAVYVDEGWWHPDVKSGQVHDHKDNQPMTMHRQCEPVYTKRGTG